MYATSTSNIINVIIVSAVLSVLVTENDTSPSLAISEMQTNALTAQKNFRQCVNSSDSNGLCVKLIDDLSLGIVSNDAMSFKNSIATDQLSNN